MTNYRFTQVGLPFYTREVPEFKGVLGSNAAQVIQAMDQAEDDIPEQRPPYPIALPAVGVQRQHIPVKIVDPFDSQQVTTLVCDLSLCTAIPLHKRGIHMSRIGNLIADSTSASYENLQHYASHLAVALNDCQYGGPSEVHVSGILSYIEAVQGWKPAKDKRSLESIRLYASAVANQEQVVESAGLRLAHITACPCVQQTYKHALLQSNGDVEKAHALTAPFFTHSQRCETEVQIENLPQRLSMQKLLELLDQVLYRTQNTLPREYEVLLVYRAHREPQFIEDATRQVIAALYAFLQDDVYANCAIKVHATSMESIHDFDIESKFYMTMSELKKVLGSVDVQKNNGFFAGERMG